MHVDTLSDSLTGRTKWLFRLDTGLFGAAIRYVIGLLMVPLYVALRGTGKPFWELLAFIVIALFAIRLVPAILRKLVPFPAILQEGWAARRRLAKYYDSYQWQKLLWIGIGLAHYAIFFSAAEPTQLNVAIICTTAGALGSSIWLSIATDPKKPKPGIRRLK